MANEIRLRSNFMSGSLTDNPLTVGATSANSANFSTLPVVDATSVLVLVLDPLGASGAPEIVYVTAHTAASTSVTIVRAQETSTARQFPTGTLWFHAPTARDFELSPNALAPFATRYAEFNGADQIITAGVLLSGLSITVLVPANRRLKLTMKGSVFTSVNDDTANLQIREGATILNSYTISRLTGSDVFSYLASAIISPTAGSHTYTGFGLRSTGTGVVQHRGNANNVSYILAEDIGPVV